jgi:hypothetical protein
MAKSIIDRGPVALQAVTVAEQAVNNIGVTITDRAGPVSLRAVFTITNPAAQTPTDTLLIGKNAVAIAGVSSTLTHLASDRLQGVLEHVDQAAVGDVYTLRISSTVAGAGHQLEVNQTSLTVEALSQDAALVAGIGPVTA